MILMKTEKSRLIYFTEAVSPPSQQGFLKSGFSAMPLAVARWAKFTLIELLFVIAIVAILAAILLPALSLARERVKCIQCSGQMKNIGLAFTMYSEDCNSWLPPNQVSMNGGIFTWGHVLQPFMGIPETVKYAKIYECSSDRYAWTNSIGAKSWMNPSYGVNRLICYADYGAQIFKIKDLSNKILIGDVRHYAEGSDAQSYLLYNNSSVPAGKRGLYNRHSNGCNVLWCDGHLSYRKDLDVLNKNDAETRAKYWNEE